MKLSLIDVAVLAAALLAWIGFRSGKLNPASRENIIYQGTGEIGTKIPDWGGGIFKSKAEREVDEMLRTPAVTKPAPMLIPTEMRGYYDLGQKPVPVGSARVINKSGTMTDSKYRDLVR